MTRAGWLWLGLWIGVFNYAAYALAFLVLGGDFVFGYAAQGHYWLSDGTVAREVAAPEFFVSKIVTCALGASFPVAILCGRLLGSSLRSSSRNAAV